MLFVLATILTNSCVDQLNVNVDNQQFILVVEGLISTQPGPHIISISKSARYGSSFANEGLIKRILDAEVLIRDQKGRVTVLSEFGFGDYLTPAGFRAEIGNSYTLQIIVAGKTYYSTPELVTKAPEIDSLIVEYKEFPSNDPFDFVSGVEVYSQLQDNEEQKDYYLWRSNGTYKFDGCWISESVIDISIRTLKDQFVNGNSIFSLAAFIEDDGKRFKEKYYVKIKQYSISQEAYLFLDLVRKQMEINGDIFDPPPATIRGNMISNDNPDEPVLGYFMASDVSVKPIFIPREILVNKQLTREINNCLALPNSTTTRPPFWVD